MTNNDIVTDLLQSDFIMYVAEFITALCSLFMYSFHNRGILDNFIDVITTGAANYSLYLAI